MGTSIMVGRNTTAGGAWVRLRSKHLPGEERSKFGRRFRGFKYLSPVYLWIVYVSFFFYVASFPSSSKDNDEHLGPILKCMNTVSFISVTLIGQFRGSVTRMWVSKALHQARKPVGVGGTAQHQRTSNTLSAQRLRTSLPLAQHPHTSLVTFSS